MTRQQQQKQKYLRQWIKETADGQKGQLIRRFRFPKDDDICGFSHCFRL